MSPQGGIHGLRVLPSKLVLPTLFLVMSLSLDLLQYVVSAGSWGSYGRILEVKQERGETNPRLAPSWFNWPAMVFFWAKLAALAVAYVLIGVYLSRV